MFFKDRADAGRKLAARLTCYADRDDVLVLALPRGGVPVAYEMGKELKGPLGETCDDFRRSHTLFYKTHRTFGLNACDSRSGEIQGAVPVWFVSWPEMQAALADDVLTVPELLSLPSLRMGLASFFKETQHPGNERPQGAGNGKVEITARGTLTDGRTFQFQVREMGVDQQSVTRHIQIEFK